MENLLSGANPLLTPGQRLLKCKGFEAAEKYPFPRDCEAPIFDEDEAVFYKKVTDVNGATTIRMFEYNEVPIPRFDPKKYVTIDDFDNFKEEILHGFTDLQQSIQSIANTGNRNPQQGNNRPNSKQNNGVSEPGANN